MQYAHFELQPIEICTQAWKLRSRLSQPELFEHALDPLRIMGVHLAAERGDVVAAHGPRIVALGAYGL